MTPDPISQRSARARVLADRYPAAADVLTFYAKLAEYQRSLIDEPRSMAVDGESLASAIPAFLEWLEREAPPALQASAVRLRRLDPAKWRGYFDNAFAHAQEAPDADSSVAMFVAEAMLQPFVERAARTDDRRNREPAEQPHSVSTCPACGDLPVVAVLREEGHGARRALVCARCATEWAYQRVACPACGEREFDALPVYAAEQFAHIRIDACDRCRRYLKTVDLSKDGLAIPQVDDLASLTLDLWARAEGYVRLRANLLRT
jgi:FdhE protein